MIVSAGMPGSGQIVARNRSLKKTSTIGTSRIEWVASLKVITVYRLSLLWASKVLMGVLSKYSTTKYVGRKRVIPGTVWVN